MRPLPENSRLAALFSEVTSTMLGISFTEVKDAAVHEHLCWRSAVLKIGTAEYVGVALGSDQAGCRLLGAKMFQCADAEVDDSMVEDTLRELVNMTGGMIKRALGLDALLGLPRVVSTLPPDPDPPADWTRLVLRGGGAEIVMYVSPQSP